MTTPPISLQHFLESVFAVPDWQQQVPEIIADMPSKDAMTIEMAYMPPADRMEARNKLHQIQEALGEYIARMRPALVQQRHKVDQIEQGGKAITAYARSGSLFTPPVLTSAS